MFRELKSWSKSLTPIPVNLLQIRVKTPLQIQNIYNQLGNNQLINESSVFRSAHPPLKSRALIPKLTIHTQQQGKLKEFSCHMQASFVVMVDE